MRSSIFHRSKLFRKSSFERNKVWDEIIFFLSVADELSDFSLDSLQVHFATQAVLDKLPQRAPSSQLSGSLFLQLTVDQLGVCIPLYNGNQVCNH